MTLKKKQEYLLLVLGCGGAFCGPFGVAELVSGLGCFFFFLKNGLDC